MYEFDWDETNSAHIAEHSVSCDEAEQVILNDPVEFGYEVHDGEERFTELGSTRAGRILMVVSTQRANRIRVVTAYDPPRRMLDRYLIEKGDSDA